MNFKLISLRDAFRNIEYQKRATKFSLFAFVLATTADKNIFPDIMSYYPELNTLTADYMLVVAPQVNMRDRDGNTVTDVAKIASFLSTGFYRHENFSHEIERFKEEQTQESIKFARFCGIGLSKLPCIVFFDTLTRPKEYIIWELHDQDAASVVKDFRLIISEIEEDQSPFTNLKKRRKQLREKMQYLTSKVDTIKSETNQRISEHNVKIKQLQSQIESLQTSLSAEIEAVQKQIDSLKNDTSKEIKAIKDQGREILKLIDSLDKESEDTPKPDLLAIISNLKRGKFLRFLVSKVGGVVPLLQLGLSVIEIFDQP